MMGQIRFVPGGGQQKLGRNDRTTLMDQLIERVLPVGARLPPDDRTAGIGQIRSVHGDALAVGFHF